MLGNEKNDMKSPNLSAEDTDRVIEMAWEDRTPFDAIEAQFGLMEKQIIALMRREMKRSSFNLWRQRVTGRSSKHAFRHPAEGGRFHCSTQSQRVYGSRRHRGR